MMRALIIGDERIEETLGEIDALGRRRF